MTISTMSETASEKSRGLKFAEQQLLRHGWEQGEKRHLTVLSSAYGSWDVNCCCHVLF